MKGTSRQAASWSPDDRVTVLRGIGSRAEALLKAVGVRTLHDLLTFFPRRLQEFEEIPAPAPAQVGRSVRLLGRISGVHLRWLPRRRSLVTVEFEASDGVVFRVLFFNQPYLRKAYPVGELRTVEGRLELRGREYVLSPAKILPKGAAPAGSVSVQYPQIEGISESRLKAFIHQAIHGMDVGCWQDAPLPPALAADHFDFATALRTMHTPSSLEEFEQARSMFAVREAVEIFRRVERARRGRLSRRGLEVVVDEAGARRIGQSIPFAWTPDQAAAVSRIREAIAGPSPMGMLLQGDVGTGKTAVAVYAALALAAAGYQTAFLAPTELLAEQHFTGIEQWLAGTGIGRALLTGSLRAEDRRAADRAVRSGEAKLIFGTHALFSESTVFDHLGLVVIDEQHRFGVKQRMSLVHKAVDPHVLVMTATPIPRTLALTVFGDLDIVTLEDRPGGHRTPRAFWLPPKGWRRILGIIRRRVSRSEKVFVVCPKIGEGGERGGADLMFSELAKIFPCGLVHGRLPSTERQETIGAFIRGDVHVLVGTTVLEVGVDVEDATLMVIVHADRFGLSTLHQLRGRVGRGRRRGVCILTGAMTDRVAAICRTTDGFELAEEDLRLRGTGELLGTRQSGRGDLRALDPVADQKLLMRVRQAVREEAG